MAFFHLVYGAQGGLCPTDEVICVQETGLRSKPQKKPEQKFNPCGPLIFDLESGLTIYFGTSKVLTWGAGAANMQGIIQLGDSVLDDVLSFCDGTLQQRKLLVQKLLFQLLLLARLHAPAYRLMHGTNVTMNCERVLWRRTSGAWGHCCWQC